MSPDCKAAIQKRLDEVLNELRELRRQKKTGGIRFKHRVEISNRLFALSLEEHCDLPECTSCAALRGEP